MKWTVTTPPAARPVTWLSARAHLRLDSADDRTYVEDLIDAAADHAQDAMGCSLGVQTITAVFYAGEPVELPRGPLVAVTSVTDDLGNAIAAARTGGYRVERAGTRDVLRVDAAATFPLTVVYTAGHATVPAAIRQALLMHVGTLYENRESVADRAKVPVPHGLADFYRLKAREVGVG